MEPGKLSIEEVTERLGVTARTLHYYEEIGLIRDVPRTEGGHRYFDEPLVQSLEHIIRLKNLLGISLQEIGTILEAEQKLERLKASYHQEASGEERDRILDQAIGLLQRQIEMIDEKIEKLNEMKMNFETRLQRAASFKEKTDLQ